MKLQNLTVIFIIIIIPVVLLVSLYISTGLKTIKYQSLYDAGLLTATHSAISAFELNTTNDAYSDNAETKRNILKSSVKMFEKSLANTCEISSYNVDEIEEYIPAIVFGMYDGFYMYAPSLNPKTRKYEHSLKNYVYYSEKLDDGTVIIYSLDNHVTVSGKFKNEDGEEEYQVKEGYLIDLNDSESDGRKYKGIEIKPETINGIENTEGIEYYKDAYKFTNWFLNIAKVQEKYKDGEKCNYLNIGSLNDNDPEDENSAFIQHKREIIKNKIEGVLNSTITAYSERTLRNVYKMPKLSEEDWQKIYSNISMIAFFQGKNIGLTKYNGYCVLNSTNSNEYVNPNLMYFIEGSDNTDHYYHDIRCSKISSSTQLIGYKIGDFQKIKLPKALDTNGTPKKDGGKQLYNNNGTETTSAYKYNHYSLACYDCVNGSLSSDTTIYDYVKNSGGATYEIKTAYWTSLARERYNTVKLLETEEESITIPDPDVEFSESDLNYTYDGASKYKILSNSPIGGGVTANGKKSMIINATFLLNNEGTHGNQEMIVATTENSGWSLSIKRNNEFNYYYIEFAIYHNDERKYIICNSDPISLDTKYNVTAIYDGTYMKLYVNGINQTVMNVGEIQLTQMNNIPTMIGANPTSNHENIEDGRPASGYLNGKVYNIKLWYNQNFNNEQIKAIQ